MTAEVKKEIQLEIGHVLFIDIVGYSKLLINEQSEQIQKLKEIVRGTQQFRLAEAEGKLIRLPTGDGGALVFRTNLEAPVLCALEVAKALKDYPELRVRRPLAPRSNSTGKQTLGRCARRLMRSSRKDRAPLSAPRTSGSFAL